ncbi:hypothetical protein [Pseudoalteromonas sp. HL-AS1]|uniref:hypothetical protein n=1 Tax=Pseudoalteromonas sp. HL-AS1 TaxID=3071081 RepID=UPI002814E827|nr:hypothetical protein [Pseudoalteromonas sp. HL-AS1]WMS89953.1 hypothetical protein RB214_12145 [Pseudoalteromonas sp. HL-AS1]
MQAKPYIELISEIEQFNTLIRTLLVQVKETDSSNRGELFQDVMLTTEIRNKKVSALLALTKMGTDYTDYEAMQHQAILEAVAQQDKILIELFSKEKSDIHGELLKFKKNTTRINTYNIHKPK